MFEQPIPVVTATLLLNALNSLWRSKVNGIVIEPYLDEVFHIRQAQAYCAGRFEQWDPKITTPPGIYAISWLLHQFGSSCDIDTLRAVNGVFYLTQILILSFLLCSIPYARVNKEVTHRVLGQATLRNLHTALNICLFPPLFFFSALYYSDVGSTAFVLLSYLIFQHHSFQQIRGPAMILVGLVALLFRQTNIFWIAVFPAGLVVINVLSAGNSPKSDLKGQKRLDYTTVLSKSRNGEGLYDPFVGEANLEGKLHQMCLLVSAAHIRPDYAKTVLSIGAATAANFSQVLRALIPYGVLLTLFGAFVAWNGGVVLGDKSNHVATLHLPQMLYIWPYMLFFSFPLMYTHALGLLIPKNLLPLFLQLYATNKPQSSAHYFAVTLVLIVFLVGFLAIIHFNTIIHPFTLADNRHYVFYVFRLLLRRPLIKYFVAPIYLFCGWAVLQTLGTPPTSQEPNFKLNNNQKTVSTTTQESAYHHLPPEQGSCRISFILVWIAAATLSLITAPLVEPRYFIVPWLMWRLQVPSPAAWRTENPPSPTGKSQRTPLQSSPEHLYMAQPGRKQMAQALRHQDHRLWLETLWFLFVNLATGYVFLYRGFEWQQEPGNVQRFMW